MHMHVPLELSTLSASVKTPLRMWARCMAILHGAPLTWHRLQVVQVDGGVAPRRQQQQQLGMMQAAAAAPVDASNASSRGGRSRRGAWLARLTVAAAFAGVVVAAAIQPRRRISRGAAPGLVSHPMQSSRC